MELDLGSVDYPQDLHVHTVFSAAGSSVVPEHTPELEIQETLVSNVLSQT